MGTAALQERAMEVWEMNEADGPKPVLYAFEGVTEDLVHPPIAARRALAATGVALTGPAWNALEVARRRALATLGSHDRVNTALVHHVLGANLVRDMKLVPGIAEPRMDTVPRELERALLPYGHLTVDAWRSLRPVDRFALASVGRNPRMLALAAAEILPLICRPHAAWSGTIAEAHARASTEAVARVASPDFEEGRALGFARASGVKAARALPDTFVGHAEVLIGAVELDHAVDADGLLWQAHVSTWEGAFSPLASLIAATMAATATVDLLRAHDETASVVAALRESVWRVGTPGDLELSTSLFAPTPR
jgi:molybdenum cofactor biosynthesis enzyme